MRRRGIASALAVLVGLRASESWAQTAVPGVSWRSGAYSGRLSAFVQGELQLRQGSEPLLSEDGRRLLNADRFLLRRARAIATVETRWVQLLLELDGNTVNRPAVGLQNAEATLRWLRAPTDALPVVALTVGLFRVPFGYQNLQGARDWGFLEPTLAVQAFFPGQSDLGARLAGGLGWFRYQVAVTNGHPVDDRSYPLNAPTAPKDVVGRLGVDVSTTATRLQTGLSALYGEGFHPGSPATPDTISHRDINQTGVLETSGLMLTPGQRAVAARTFPRWAAGVDVVLTVRQGPRWRFMVFGEAAYAQNLDRSINVANPIANGAPVRELGWAVGSWHLLWERLLVGARIDGYDPNADALTRANGRLVPARQSYLTGSFLVGWAFDDTNRLLLQYDLLRDHLAIDSAGQPTDLRNDQFTARLQVGL